MNAKRRKPQLTAAGLQQAAECLRLLAHPQRLKIIQLLLGERAYSVSELAEACEIAQPQASDHLRLMQRCGFLKSRRQGREVYYEIAEPHLAQLMACMESRFAEH